MSFRNAVCSAQKGFSEGQLQFVTELSLVNQSDEMEGNLEVGRNNVLKEKDAKSEKRIRAKRVGTSWPEKEPLTPPEMILTPRRRNTQKAREQQPSFRSEWSPPDHYATEKQREEDRYDSFEFRDEPPPPRSAEEQVRAANATLSCGICPSCARPLIQSSITTAPDMSSANVILCNSNSSIASSIRVDGGSSYCQNMTGLSSFGDDESSLRTYHEYATKKLEDDVERLAASAQPIIEKKTACFGNGLGCSMMLPLNCLYNGLIGSYCDNVKAENQEIHREENNLDGRINLDSLVVRQEKNLPPYCQKCEAYIVFDSGDDKEREQLLQDLANWLARSYSQESSGSSIASQNQVQRPQRASIMVAASYPPPDSDPERHDLYDANYAIEDKSWSDGQFVDKISGQNEELPQPSRSMESKGSSENLDDPEEKEVTLSDQLHNTPIQGRLPDENSQYLRNEENTRYDEHEGKPSTFSQNQHPYRSLSALTVQKDPPEVQTANKAFDAEGAIIKETKGTQDGDYKLTKNEIPTVESAESISTIKEEQTLISDYQEKRRIATKAIGKMLMEGYLLTQIQCNLCEMPLMAKNGNSICVVCPLVEKKAKKRASQKRIEQSGSPNQFSQPHEANASELSGEKQSQEQTKSEGQRIMSVQLTDSTSDPGLSHNKPKKILADINKFCVTNQDLTISASLDQSRGVRTVDNMNAEGTPRSAGIASPRYEHTEFKSSDKIYELEVNGRADYDFGKAKTKRDYQPTDHASGPASPRYEPTEFKSSEETYDLDANAQEEYNGDEVENIGQRQPTDPTFLSEEVYRRLLNGWLLTDSHCSDCCGPLMQSPTNEIQCIFCDQGHNIPPDSLVIDRPIKQVSGITERLMRGLSLSGTEGTGTDESYSQPPSQQFDVESSLSVPTSEGYKYFVVPEDLDLDDDEALLNFLKQNRRNNKPLSYQNEREEANQYSTKHSQANSSYRQLIQHPSSTPSKRYDSERVSSGSEVFSQDSSPTQDKEYFRHDAQASANEHVPQDYYEDTSKIRHPTAGREVYMSDLKNDDENFGRFPLSTQQLQLERRGFPYRGDAPEQSECQRPDPPSVNESDVDYSLRHSDQMYLSRSHESNDSKPELVFSRSSETTESYDKAVNSDTKKPSSDYDNKLLLTFDEPEEARDSDQMYLSRSYESNDSKPELVFSRSSETTESYDKAVNSDTKKPSPDYGNELLLTFDEPEEAGDVRHGNALQTEEGDIQNMSQTSQEIVSEYVESNSYASQESNRMIHQLALKVKNCRLCEEQLGEMHSNSDSFMCHNTKCTLFGIPTHAQSQFTADDPTVDTTVSPLGDEDTYDKHIMNLQSQLELSKIKDERWESASVQSSGSDASIKMVASDTMDAIKEKMKNTSTKLLSNQDLCDTFEEDMDLAMLMQRLADAGRAIKELEHTVNDAGSGYEPKRHSRGRPPKSPTASPRSKRVLSS